MCLYLDSLCLSHSILCLYLTALCARDNKSCTLDLGSINNKLLGIGVAQLTVRPLPIREDQVTNPILGYFYWKTKRKKRPGKAHFKKNNCLPTFETQNGSVILKVNVSNCRKCEHTNISPKVKVRYYLVLPNEESNLGLPNLPTSGLTVGPQGPSILLMSVFVSACVTFKNALMFPPLKS